MEVISFEKEGFAGVFIPANNRTDAVIIYCDGAGNTMEEAIHNGSFLQKTNYSILILGYYRWEGLSNTLSDVPVEYVERAIHWLKKRINEHIHIGIAGMSAGGQYALLAASLIPEIQSVAVASTYDYLVEGTDAKLHRLNRSPFSYRNQPLSYAPLSVMDQGMILLLLKILFDRKYGIGRMLRYGYDHSPVNEQSRIKVEKINGNLLMLASENDDCLPAEETVRRVQKILLNNGFPHHLETYIYEKGSHILGCDFDLDSKDGKDAQKIFKAWKLDPEGCKEAMQDSMERMIAFFQKELQ